jgi:hypothetical protein
MRRLLIILGIPLILCVWPKLVQAQEPIDTITRVEYFVNVDPGYGSATALDITSDINIELIFNAVVAGLEPNKMHIIGIRAKNGEGDWGPTTIHRFFVNQLLDDEPTPNLTKAEYFIDNDVGYGEANELTFNQGVEDQITPIIDVADLDEGFHILGIRAKNENIWGHTYIIRFFVDNSPTNPDLEEVTAIEYFFDSEAGYDQGVSIEITPSDQIAITPTLDISSLQEGFHTIGIRAKHQKMWGPTQIQRFMVDNSHTNPDLENITALEYFIDNDQGYGSSTQIEIISAPDIQITPQLPLTDIARGFHTIGIRAKDNNMWGQTHIGRFFVEDDLQDVQPPNLAFIEYFFNTDDGFGSGIIETITPSQEIDTLINPILDGLELGSNFMGIRACDEHGKYSQTYIHPFTLIPFYTITATADENGIIVPSGEVLVDEGQNQNFGFEPNVGYVLKNIVVDGAGIGTTETYEFANVSVDHTIHAQFALDTMIITATAGIKGAISPSGSVKVPYGTNQSFEFLPDYGFQVLDVLVDGESIGPAQTLELVNVITDRTIHVEFTIQTFVIYATFTGSGNIEPSGEVVVEFGSDVAFVIAPAEGSRIGFVQVDGEELGALFGYNFSDVTQNHSINVDFVGLYDEGAQGISLLEGWNIFSSYLLPPDADMLSVVQPLLYLGALVKVQDQAGNSVEHVVDQWINDIGDLSLSQGYKIKLNQNAHLVIYGTPSTEGVAIPLSSAWNIMGYPHFASQNALEYVQDLIDEGVFQKMQSETGAAVENLPGFEWINSIGHTEPGEGYLIRVNANTTINPAGKHFNDIPRQMRVNSVFEPSWKGNGYSHHNIFITEARLNEKPLPSGTQIGVFDGDLCVGIGVVDESSPYPLPLIAVMDDPYTSQIDGFTNGNSIALKIWDAESEGFAQQVDIWSQGAKYLVFEAGGSTLINLSAATSVTHVDPISELSHLGSIFPNPLTSETNIYFYLAGSEEVTIAVYNLMGQKVETLIAQKLEQGNHRVSWNPYRNMLPQGVYLIRMETRGVSQTRRVVYWQ